MRGRDHVGACLVNGRVDGEGGLVDRPTALDDLTAVVDQDQVAHSDLLEAHAEGIDPEVVEPFGVARGDVPGNSLVESQATEDAERSSEALFAVETLVLG